MTKQSNSQKQTVNVTVNNKMACCEKPKKKRKSKPKPKPRQEEPEMPMDDGFPVLNTPSPSRPTYSAVPIRNTVYMPSTVQISPEGMMPPIPDYFQRPYTNLIRTMEDFQNNLMKELNDVRQTARPTVAPQGTQTMPDPIATQTMPEMAGQQTQTMMPEMAGQQTQTMPNPIATQTMPELSMSEPQSMFDISPQVPVVTREEARSPMQMNFRPNMLFEEDEPIPASSPMRIPRNQNLTMQDQVLFDLPPETRQQKLFAKFPQYLREFEEASGKSQKGKAFEKIKKVGKEFGLIETRGRGVTMEDYVRRVQAQVLA